MTETDKEIGEELKRKFCSIIWRKHLGGNKVSAPKICPTATKILQNAGDMEVAKCERCGFIDDFLSAFAQAQRREGAWEDLKTRVKYVNRNFSYSSHKEIFDYLEGEFKQLKAQKAGAEAQGEKATSTIKPPSCKDAGGQSEATSMPANSAPAKYDKHPQRGKCVPDHEPDVCADYLSPKEEAKFQKHMKEQEEIRKSYVENKGLMGGHENDIKNFSIPCDKYLKSEVKEEIKHYKIVEERSPPMKAEPAPQNPAKERCASCGLSRKAHNEDGCPCDLFMPSMNSLRAEGKGVE
jgi:hypothetical protein